MSRFKKKPERSVKSDTNVAKKQLRSVGYAEDTSVAEESGQES